MTNIKFTADSVKGLVEEISSTDSSFTFMSGTAVIFSGSAVAISGFTGSLLGTASYSIYVMNTNVGVAADLLVSLGISSW